MTTPHAGEYVCKLAPLYVAGRIKHGVVTLQNSSAVPHKTNATQPCSCTLGHLLRRNESSGSRKHLSGYSEQMY